MRYEIGQKIWTVFFHNLDYFLYPSYSQFMPWEAKEFPNIEFRELTIVEHHKVNNEWESRTDEPKCDGFILQDDTGRIWHNQYPHASYGQIDDKCDGLFRLFLEKQRPIFDEVLEFIGNKREARQNGSTERKQSPHVIEMYDLMRELSQINHGSHRLLEQASNPLNDVAAMARLHKLNRWYAHIVEQFEATTGLKIAHRPITFTNTKTGVVTTLDGHAEYYVAS